MENDTKEQAKEIFEDFSDNLLDFQQTISDENELVTKAEGKGNIKLYILDKIINTWQTKHSADIELRKVYAKWLFVLLVIETVAVFVIVFITGFKRMEFDEWTFRVFIGSVYAQIVGAVYVMIRYLFSKDSHVILGDIATIVEKMNGDKN
ncbi:hypothetical protein [Selenomonas sp. AE3005]|uniref:hypothetical protein n=1 Tax=Selenomonas sp. AE3005 TaxID=1485543 RepID=UPI0025F641E4|nr:hypothetical protein [Selenomonas sp. AE3005]